MSTLHVFRLAPLVLALACTGLDPDAFKPRGSPPEPDGAGWSFDAGVAPDAGGGGARASASGGSATSVDGGGESEGGAGPGGDADGGAGAVGAGGTGGSASVSGNENAGGSGSGGMAGRGGSGGTFEAGRAAGGQSGQAGGGQAGQPSAGAGGSLRTHAVYFSEYVEGSSSYKALELAAREDSTLTGCRLATYFNGATMATGITLEGSLTAGSTYVLCSSGLGPVLETMCARTTNLTFNGDDAVALECDGTVLDVIGQIGVDPGDAWTNGETSTLNQTLRRRCAASFGDQNGSDAFDPAAEWAALPIDTFDGLGAAECPIDESR